jgi:hypothetical protein
MVFSSLVLDKAIGCLKKLLFSTGPFSSSGYLFCPVERVAVD